MKAIKNAETARFKMLDSEIVNRIIAGEKELYEILIRRNNQKLYRVIRAYLKEEEEIEDIMQSTYLTAYEKLHLFKQASSFSTWLIRIGINKSLGRINEKGKILAITQKNDNHVRKPVFDISDNNQSNPEKKIILKETRQLLETTIDSLDPKYRLIFILKEVEGMKNTEIAECLDLSVANVKVRLHRAKLMLKEKLYKQAYNKDIFEFGSSRCDRMTDKVMKLIL